MRWKGKLLWLVALLATLSKCEEDVVKVEGESHHHDDDDTGVDVKLQDGQGEEVIVHVRWHGDGYKDHPSLQEEEGAPSTQPAESAKTSSSGSAGPVVGEATTSSTEPTTTSTEPTTTTTTETTTMKTTETTTSSGGTTVAATAGDSSTTTSSESSVTTTLSPGTTTSSGESTAWWKFVLFGSGLGLAVLLIGFLIYWVVHLISSRRQNNTEDENITRTIYSYDGASPMNFPPISSFARDASIRVDENQWV